MNRFLPGLSVCLALLWGMLGLLCPRPAYGQGDQIVYGDSLQNGWQNWGWATLDYNNSSPTHAGGASIRVTATAWQALYLHNDAIDSSKYTALTFWIQGGPTGGQRLVVQATISQTYQPPGVAVGPLKANEWQQITIPLSALGVAGKPNFDGFWIADATGSSQPIWYVDDIRLVGTAGAGTGTGTGTGAGTVNLQVNASQVVRTVDNRLFGMNAVTYDRLFNTQSTIDLLLAMDNKTLRFPGGSVADHYHWATNTSDGSDWTWATSFDAFANVAGNRGTNAQVYITVNYGSGTPEEAAAWVRYSNITKNYGFKYWEIGNECYGDWEHDTHGARWDAVTYANAAREYTRLMKAVDGSIKIGVVLADGWGDMANRGEDTYSYNNGYVQNPRTGAWHNGWNAVLLTTLRNQGVTPDFVIYHKYAQLPGGENDAALLQSASTWASDMTALRRMLSDYLGAAANNIEIVCTEANSVSSNPGKQTRSLVNGLFLADTLGQALQTELGALHWWSLRDVEHYGNNSASLYGWRQNGDYGVLSGNNERHPTYFVAGLLRHFARGGDQVVRASSDNPLLAAYAARRLDGSLSLLVINKSPTAAQRANIALSGYTPGANGTAYSYGIPQDEAARSGVGSQEVAQTTFTGAGANFSYTFPAYSVTVLSLR